MSPTARQAGSFRRLVLVPAGPRTDRTDELIRRYRLARLRLEDRPTPPARRFDHLSHPHD